MYPDSTIVGLDITSEYLDIAQSKMQPHQRDRIFFYQHNADELEMAELAGFGPFDLIISSYLPKYVDLSKLTRNCHALLAPGGLLLIHDFTRPRLLLLRALYNVYWLILSLFLRFSPWREAGRDLKKIIWRNDWVREFETVCPESQLQAGRNPVATASDLVHRVFRPGRLMNHSGVRCRSVLGGMGGTGVRLRTELRSTREGVMIVCVTKRISGWRIFSSRMFAAFSPISKLG